MNDQWGYLLDVYSPSQVIIYYIRIVFIIINKANIFFYLFIFNFELKIIVIKIEYKKSKKQEKLNMLMIFKIERKKSKNQNFFDLPKFLKSKNYSEAFAKKHIVHPESKQMQLKSEYRRNFLCSFYKICDMLQIKI